MKHIHLQDVAVGYNDQIVVDKINISLMRGKMTCILGPNGSGKTTVLKTISNLISRLGGVVEIAGTDLDGFKPGELAREMSIVLTNRMDLPGMTGFDVAAMGRYPHTGFFGILSQKDIQYVETCIEKCGAPNLKDRYFHELSDGEKQKILIARGLAQAPNIILLDEPTSHLDIKHKLEVLTTLKSLSIHEQKTVVCTLHEPELAIKCCDYLVLVKDDRILACGPTDEVIASGKLDDLYGFSGRFFDAQTGLIEFQAAPSKDIFVVGTDEATTGLFRRLNRQKIGFATGVLHKNDVNYHIAKTMNTPVIAADAYAPITSELIEKAFEMAMHYEQILVSRSVMCDINYGNQILVQRLKAVGKQVSFLDESQLHADTPVPVSQKFTIVSHLPRFVLAGTGSNCGKTTVTAALLRAFKLAGHSVQPFKVGPDYIDPMFHLAASGHSSANLDSWLLGSETIKQLFYRRMQDSQSDLALIEGVMGYYDGLNDQLSGSTAELAGILDAPVVLLVDGSGLGLSICALVSGYQKFSASAGRQIAGVIINQVTQGGFHYLKPLLEKHCAVPVLGYLPPLADCHLGSRHLGLVPAAEDRELDVKLDRLGQKALETIDLKALLKLAAAASPLKTTQETLARSSRTPLRIGVAMDKAFNFYYEDNLNLLHDQGAELCFFSPMSDQQLPPDLDGLYLGGGYPELFAETLSKNLSLRTQIRKQVLAGLPTVAECGGFLYLGESLCDPKGVCHPMCGVVPVQAEMTDRLQHFGYQTLTLQKDGLLGRHGDQIRIHEFHYCTSSDYGQDCLSEKPSGASRKTVFHSDSAWIGFPHLHFHNRPEMVENWLKRCQDWRASR